MEYETNSLYDTLRKVVNTPEFRRACGHWEPRECPGSKDTKKLIGDASELIENRVCMNVDSWEKKFQVKKTLKEKIISKLKRDCELMEDQIREIESKFFEFFTQYFCGQQVWNDEYTTYYTGFD